MKKWLWQAILTIYLSNYRLKKKCEKVDKLFFNTKGTNSTKVNSLYSLELFKHLLKLSAVKKVPETRLFQALGSFESKTVQGTVLA